MLVTEWRTQGGSASAKVCYGVNALGTAPGVVLFPSRPYALEYRMDAVHATVLLHLLGNCGCCCFADSWPIGLEVCGSVECCLLGMGGCILFIINHLGKWAGASVEVGKEEDWLLLRKSSLRKEPAAFS